MRKFIRCLVLIHLFIYLMYSFAGAEIVWKEAGRGVRGSGFRAVSIDPLEEETVFIGSGTEVYRTTDKGESWKVVFSARSTGNAINTIAIDRSAVYIGTERGLYMSRDLGGRWEKIFSSIGSSGKGVLFAAADPVNPDAIYIGTGSGFFYSKDGGNYWEKGRNLSSGVHYISLESSLPRTVYAAADNGIYKSTSSGAHWERVYETKLPEEDAGNDEDENGESEEAAEVRCVVISPGDSSMLLAGTSKGLLISKDSGRTWSRAGSLGLVSRDIRHVAFDNKGKAYAATDRGVYSYSSGTDSWDEGFPGLGLSPVRYLAAHGGDVRLWAAAERGIYKAQARQEVSGYQDVNETELFLKFAGEPTIEEIRQAAIIYAEVHPSKISKWRKAAARKALLPDLRVGFDKNRDWQSSTYFYSTSSQKYTDDDVTRGDDSGWSVSLTWELGELIWNNDQTSIDSRSRYAVQLRDDLLNEVTRLYFERRRLQVSMLISPPSDVSEKVESEIRLQELTAGIDALTDSYLSKRLKRQQG